MTGAGQEKRRDTFLALAKLKSTPFAAAASAGSSRAVAICFDYDRLNLHKAADQIPSQL